MKRALLVALMCMVPWKPNIKLIDTIAEQKFIEENNLIRIKISCYIASPGAHTADGSIPIEGYCSGNKEHLGQDLILYDEDLVAVGRYEIRDVGGHPMLRNGTAIDFYRDSLSRCYEFVATHGSYAYIQYIDRNEGKDEEISGDSVECGYETRLQERKRVNDKREARPDIR